MENTNKHPTTAAAAYLYCHPTGVHRVFPERTKTYETEEHRVRRWVEECIM